MNEIINVPMTAQRDIQTVTVEINTLFRQGQGIALNYIIEIGRRLCEAKEMLSHGEWGDWMEKELPFSASTARSYMRAFREYGDRQINFFGDPKQQALADLEKTKAIRLLTIGDEEEREAFIASHDVEEMSSRELEKAIRERDEAIRARDAAAAEAAREAEAAAEAKKRAEKAAGDAGNHFKTAQDMQKKLTAAEEQAKKAKEDAAAAKKKAAELKEALKKAKEAPEVSEDVLSKLREEAAEKAASAVKAAESAAAQAEAEAEKLRKALAASDRDVTIFGERFSTVQTDFDDLWAAFDAVKAKDGQKAEKLKGAVAALLSKLSGEVEAW